ncbi:DNA gyrase subunit A [Pseudothermotoga thermarum]|uniref:DNA gyrase subunit A n=1 Tax=Pseudothermotoga thermarum DSM 5069 TaxID=688269 RepID=F7YV04_9THEM|nr:DNA gyrase subunit A [Pseudothermotoga thermarum]AEH50288.1 DNA gyrase subunit A [Pseudothermotoga thermarum DSM 5069]
MVTELLTRPIEEELVELYMNYSMSVIIGRAIPDVRDGLKPVQRRILYAMYELGLTHNAQTKKSARIVGEVIGKYHPHGDAAVYDALVRMAQPFVMRYPLVIGQGNFGSIDRDPPAAMRYTEAKLSQLAEEMLEDLDKETVPMTKNFDDTLEEPTVLPAKVPNLLLNGASGIAVGMATNIPPHNLAEVVEAIRYVIKNPNATISKLLQFIKGPDFPTGGIVVNAKELPEVYATGKGRIIIRAKTHFEEDKKFNKIVITEIPYTVSKASLVEEIANYATKEPKLMIKNVRDESDKTGLRIVIELAKNADKQVVLNNLFKNTKLEDSFNVQMLVIDAKKPKLMNLQQLIKAFINHRFEVIRKRAEYQFKVYSKRAHIIEGLIKAARAIGVVVDIVRTSKDSQEAIKNLIETLSITEEQAKAILDMRLGRLTSLEVEKLQSEYSQLIKNIEEAKEIITKDEKVYEVMDKELEEIERKYKDERRTQIMDLSEELDHSPESYVVDEEIVLTLTQKGYLKATSLRDYRTQRRGGKGVIGVKTSEDDEITMVCSTRSLAQTLFISSKGKAFVLKNYEIEVTGRDSKGKPIRAYLNLEEDEIVVTMLPFDEWKGDLVLVTKQGKIKRTPLKEFENAASRGIKAITFEDNDCVVAAKLCYSDSEQVLMATKNGMAIRFSMSEVRPMGRAAMGVKGIELRENDEVVGMVSIPNENCEILTVTTKGFGKRTPVAEYRLQNRGGIGIKTLSEVEKVGTLAGVDVVTDPQSEVLLMTKNGQSIRLSVSAISVLGRTAKGVKILELDGDDEVSHFAVIEKCTEN